jgi:hypothetical protein
MKMNITVLKFYLAYIRLLINNKRMLKNVINKLINLFIALQTRYKLKRMKRSLKFLKLRFYVKLKIFISLISYYYINSLIF